MKHPFKRTKYKQLNGRGADPEENIYNNNVFYFTY